VNTRTNILQQIREERRDDTRLFLGNNKMMMIALGRDEGTSFKPNLHKLSKFLQGHCGLLCTNLPKKEVKDYFGSVGAAVYARTGQTAGESLTIPAGPLPQFPHSMFEHLSKLGLPIKLDKGVIVLLQDTTVCEAGDALSAEAAQLLKLFGMQTAEFRIDLTAHWSNGVARKVGGAAKAADDAVEN
jgi:mRNA turnover protein 4